MKRITAIAASRRIVPAAAALGLAFGLGACTVYDGPGYPAYGAYPHSSSTFEFRGSFDDDDDRRRHRRHRHHRGHR